MRIHRLLSCLSLLLSACGPLSSQPGPQLDVRFSHEQDNSKVQLVQAVGRRSFEFTVGGCTDFDAQGVVTYDKVERRYPLTPEEISPGHFRASLKVEELRPELSDCGAFDQSSRDRPNGSLHVVVACKQDGREGRTRTSKFIEFQLAHRDAGLSGGAMAIYPLGENAVGIRTHKTMEMSLHDFSGSASMQVGSFLFPDSTGMRQLGREVYFFFGDDSDPREIVVNAETGEMDTVWGGRVVAWEGSLNFWVPGTPLDLGREGTEDTAVGRGAGYLYFSKLKYRASSPQQQGELRAAIKGETALSRIVSFQNRPAIFTQNKETPDQLSIRWLDGSVAQTVTLSGDGDVEELRVDPRGENIAYQRGKTIWVQNTSGTAKQLRTAIEPAHMLNMEWLESGALAFSRWEELEIHSKPGDDVGQRIALPTNEERAPKRAIWDIQALGGGAFAVLTGSGIQLLDQHGVVRAGADPLPTACGGGVHMMARVNAKAVAVTMANSVLLFQLPE